VPAPASAARGLSAAELGDAIGELQALAGTRVVDALPVRTAAGPEDLLLVLQPAGEASRKVFLHVALGSQRARVTTTGRRFDPATRLRGPQAELLLRELAGAWLQAIGQPVGERRCELRFDGQHGARRLVVELFGSRGLWALLDADGRTITLSRPIETAVRTLRTGDRYEPPPPGSGAAVATARRFAAPVLSAIDTHFTELDEQLEFAHERDRLLAVCRRALQKARAKAAGLAASLADAGRAAALRAEADLLLAYAGTVTRGATELLAPDPAQDGVLRRIELDPARPVVAQAQQRYEKARRLDDGRAITERRRADADAATVELAAVAASLAAASTAAALAAAHAALQRLGAVPPAGPTRPAPRGPAVPRTENYRRFTSAEGYTILVGRDNEQNDRLTLRTANGNDLWLHVGGGRAGSHVVVRLPKGKTASLETLLDAATLAVHFSKARGEARIDVVYTQRKHVRKPKGLPPGAVVPSQTRTVTVRADAARLQRLLDSAPADDST
jgi:predicted ribosome quality control (RQC) complex YloA/Tae2 family protein